MSNLYFGGNWDRLSPFKNQIHNCIVSDDCLNQVPDEPQVVAGGKEFTYDYVFGSSTGQSPIFDNCVSPLLDKFFAGYNCTILAYGQTGAGYLPYYLFGFR